MVPVVLVLSSRGCARREKKRKREKERRVETDERACSRFRVTPKSFSSRYDSLLYALDGPPSVSCSQMLVEESEIDTTRCAHALLPWRALMHCQGRIDPQLIFFDSELPVIDSIPRAYLSTVFPLSRAIRFRLEPSLFSKSISQCLFNLTS